MSPWARGVAGVGSLLIPLQVAAAEPPRTGTAAMAEVQIVKESYHGWPNTYRLSNGLVEARVVTDIGPRIMDFHHTGGANLLYLRESEAGKSGEPAWVQRGGWRLWIAPERTETTYVPDNAGCEVEVLDGSKGSSDLGARSDPSGSGPGKPLPAAGPTLRVTGQAEPASGIQKQVDVSLPPGEPRLRITSRIKNITEHALTYAAWSLPVLRPSGRAFVPFDVGPLTAFDATRRLLLWSYTRFADPRYVFGDRLIQIDHRRVTPPPKGQPGRRDDESKIGVDSAQGWAAYLLDGTLFLKRFPHDPKGQYPDGGATVEVYSSHEFLELEDLGPLTTVGPGEEIVLPEDWWLFPGVQIPLAETEALAAIQKYVDQTHPLQAGE